jgi:hypothetical protein
VTFLDKIACGDLLGKAISVVELRHGTELRCAKQFIGAII